VPRKRGKAAKLTVRWNILSVPVFADVTEARRK
jgi:hypothetical protein